MHADALCDSQATLAKQKGGVVLTGVTPMAGQPRLDRGNGCSLRRILEDGRSSITHVYTFTSEIVATANWLVVEPTTCAR